MRVDAVTGDVKMFQKAVPSLLANQNVMQRDEIKKQQYVQAKAKVNLHTLLIVSDKLYIDSSLSQKLGLYSLGRDT